MAADLNESKPHDTNYATAMSLTGLNGSAERSKTVALHAQNHAIIEWLREQNPELGNAYTVARCLLAGAPDPGFERIRVLLICHSMREVMNRLPTAVIVGRGELDRDALSKHEASSQLIRETPDLRVKYPEMDLSFDAENVPVPREAALKFNRLIDAAVYEDQRRLSDLATFRTDDANPKHPAVREWRSLSEFFTRWAHLSNRLDESIPTDQQLDEKIHVFEEHVDAIRLAFFESKRVIEDLLAEANRTIEEG